jgi:hypothetical protein
MCHSRNCVEKKVRFRLAGTQKFKPKIRAPAPPMCRFLASTAQRHNQRGLGEGHNQKTAGKKTEAEVRRRRPLTLFLRFLLKPLATKSFRS